jgi:hypothetical protein
MSNFQVGDRVRVVKEAPSRYRGKYCVGSVAFVHVIGDGQVTLEGDMYYIPDNCLELYPRFSE